MSRIGKQLIPIPGGVTVAIQGLTVSVQGPKGTLTMTHRPEVSVYWNAADKTVQVRRSGDEKAVKAYHGLTRALIANMVEGVTQGYRKELEIVGIGWTAKVQGTKLVLNVGFSDPRELEIPRGVSVQVAENQKISIGGPDKQLVGQFAAQVRDQRRPEPYNGKGIKYVGEVIIRKEGKAFAGSGGA